MSGVLISDGRLTAIIDVNDADSYSSFPGIIKASSKAKKGRSSSTYFQSMDRNDGYSRMGSGCYGT